MSSGFAPGPMACLNLALSGKLLRDTLAGIRALFTPVDFSHSNKDDARTQTNTQTHKHTHSCTVLNTSTRSLEQASREEERTRLAVLLLLQQAKKVTTLTSRPVALTGTYCARRWMQRQCLATGMCLAPHMPNMRISRRYCSTILVANRIAKSHHSPG
jgi:hypothetical protein